ncbi:putative esterase [Segniliparus rotundus DSM 44985]|uniref:Putative esterase n=1 Tax=Segniliparus rotundus (strain ATCC BAA-972 / CDC 1076 / CIP 108378 / DSM 44985 / JCM 13578) TaxID=640132 RepID=D6ZD17_SEGRD|nr:putative esterase [Segniliparus rotundus DSM 44985]
MATAAAFLLVLGLVAVVASRTAPPARADDEPSITKTAWLSDRHVEIWAHSPAMGVDVPVHILLARSWFSEPDKTFPQVFLLDSMKAGDEDNGWLKNTQIADFYADKDINVIAPVGGEASFYSDWLDSDNGKTYKWETFLTKELPPLLEQGWRCNDQRGVIGASMGGTGAMALAARNPGFFRVVASFSGILQTTSIGMPQAIDYAMKDAGGFDSAKMWGDPSNPEWAAHDPYALADKLRGTSLYISSGNGVGAEEAAADMATAAQAGGQPDPRQIAAGVSGSALELLSRLSSQSFAARLAQLGIPAQAVYRPSGTHSWPYWQFENTQLWPQLAMGLGVPQEAAACSPGGVIGEFAAQHAELGGCLTGEFDVPGGKEQDFTGGRVFWSEAGGAHETVGAIGAQYAASGGPSGPLGLPLSDEADTQDGQGKFVKFANGSVYWSPQTGAQAVHGEILKAWAAAGYEAGPTGYPVEAERPTPGGAGVVQGFQNGMWYWAAPTGAHPVGGAVLEKYAASGYEQGPLGFPISDEIPLGPDGDGRVQKFSGGNVYWRPDLGAVVVLNGPIMAEWAKGGYENSPVGFPVHDQAPVENGVGQDFERAAILVVDGQTKVVPR